MPKIFISYRRVDSETITARIYDKLKEAFGEDNVFLDEEIPAGSEWKKILQNELDKADYLFVIIGTDWVGEFKKRDRANDWVYFEVEQGLRRGDNLMIIPITVNNAKMPSEDQLPKDLVKLADLQAQPVRSRKDFYNDVDDLINLIQPQAVVETSPKRSFDWKWVIGVVVIPIIVALITISPSFLGANNNGDSTETAQVITEETVEASATASQMPSELPTNTSEVSSTTVSVTSMVTDTPLVAATRTVNATQITTASTNDDDRCLAQIVGQEGNFAQIAFVNPQNLSPLSDNLVERGSTVEILTVSGLDPPKYQIAYGDDFLFRGWLRDSIYFVSLPDCASN